MAGPSRTAATHPHHKFQPPRPPNAWILYRAAMSARIRQSEERLSQADISKRIAVLWRSESEEVKRYYEQQAEAEKERHQRLYPDYRFCPKKKEDKVREKKERKQRAKRSRDRNATPPDANDAGPSASVPTPAPPPPVTYTPQPFVISGYHHDIALSSFMAPYPHPEVQYGPAGPSPPISAAPSPASYESSESPEQNGSSSSSPSVYPSPSAESQTSSSSSLLPSNQFYPSPLPSHHTSPNPYATQPLPYQMAVPSSSQAQPPAEPMAVPAAPMWSHIHIPQPLPNLQDTQDIIRFDIPINQPQTFEELQRCISDSSSFESIESLLAAADTNGTFDLSSIDSSDLLAQPQGNLEVSMGVQASLTDYNGQLFLDYDTTELEQQMVALAEDASSSNTAPPAEDLQSLFHAPTNHELEAYMAAQQRRPSIFTQDMMNFLDFEAAEGSNEDAPAVSSNLVPTTVCPQQVRLQSQDAVAMPIFTQMTNVPTLVSDTPYVPPAGAIYWSTRRVGGSWKPTFIDPGSQVEGDLSSWNLPTS